MGDIGKEKEKSAT